ncbi:MAG: pyridoxal-phosphate dependent enzyme [Chloroflexi bacterium]|nr:pyridoxal-phosphate dependent enzyme [Chloroflexota bacterium]
MTKTAKIVPGPTYQEMLDPNKLPAAVRAQALKAQVTNELDPLNLFNITWRRPDGRINALLFPKELTGVKANIIVMLGKDLPSGSHKVGPAYTTLIEGEVAGEIAPGSHTIVGPSTGNFGIGTAYVARLKGYQALVVMPDNMSQERYERIKKYGGELDLTPGTESDVILTLERTHRTYIPNPKYKVLAQFELLPNYRFHRYVTGRSALEVARGFGNGRIAVFASAPGSAGTIGAGDEIKTVYPEAIVAALEPLQCPTLYNNGQGQHRIEGIGDKMVTLIHNILTTDYVVLIHDDDCVKGLKVIQDGSQVLARRFGLSPQTATSLVGIFGISGICNVLGAIMMDLERRAGPITPAVLGQWAEEIFPGATTEHILDVQVKEQKERLFQQKEEVWSKFGYSKAYLDSMKSQAFWDREYELIHRFDPKIKALRENV